MTPDDTPTKRYPVRPPADGPAIVLDIPALYTAVRKEMDRRGYTHAKQVCDDTGIDRNTMGRFLRRGAAGEIVHGQRGGVNVNAYLTLASWVGGTPAQYGKTIRDMPARGSNDPGLADTLGGDADTAVAEILTTPANPRTPGDRPGIKE